VSGIVWPSGANAKRVATADVSEVESVNARSHRLMLSAALYAADQKAHEEAVSNGGVRMFLGIAFSFFSTSHSQLIMYWYGTPHAATGINMATCVWQSREHAIAANSRPHHIQAMKLAAASYEMYDLEVSVAHLQMSASG
jgi:hypothetical protein